MKTKFQITNLPSIEPLKPYKETAKMYYFEGYKLPKTAVHDTYEEARAELLSQCEKQIEFYQHCLQSEVSKLKKLLIYEIHSKLYPKRDRKTNCN